VSQDEELRASEAQRIFHFRDEALDQPFGEGLELTLYRTPDGRYWRDETFVHVDADSPRVARGGIAAEAALEQVARLDPGRLRELFPDSWQARTYARFGTCRPRELAGHARDLLEDAEPVLPRTEADGPLYRSDFGLYVRQAANPAEGWQVLEPAEALQDLLQRGGERELIERHFPGSAELRLLREAGAKSWRDLGKTALPALLESAALVHTHAVDIAVEGCVYELALFRVTDELFVERTLRVGSDQPGYRLMERSGALQWLCLQPDVPSEVKERFFPDREAWRTVQERAGLSFPEV
jgi:hypothetical protein